MLLAVGKDDALRAKVRELMPGMMNTYDQHRWEMNLLYLDNAHVEIPGMTNLKEEFDL